MLDRDTRKEPIAVQEYLRRRTILLRQSGASFSDIATFLGIHRNTASAWWKAYEREGEARLSQHQRGRRLGEARYLSPEQETSIQSVLLAQSPFELGIDSHLWTRRAVQILMQQQSGKTIAIRTVGEYLKRWGYTPQKPLKRAYEQDPVAVQSWLDQEYPALKSLAQKEQAQIHWLDQSGLTSRDHRGRGYAPQGQTPQVRMIQDRHARLNYIASVTNQGKVRFMLYDERFTTPVMIRFLTRLRSDHHTPIFLILDNHPVHHAKALKNWVKEQDGKLRLFYLPSYSPDLNPAEYLNCDVKYGVHSKAPTLNKAQLAQRALSHLRKLQKLPSRVQSYFEHPSIAYAGN